MSKFKVNFIGLGAAKAGSTWLYDVLKTHPGICMSVRKEVNYFNELMAADLKTLNIHFPKPLEWYHDHFNLRQPGQICGEVSPAYLKNQNAAEAIYHYNPNVKLIAILREPVSRSFSSYSFRVQIGNWNYKTFEDAIEKWPPILSTSLYYQQLKPYFDLFPREHILILTFDDLKNDKTKFLTTIYDFLEVPYHFPEIVSKKSNVTGVPGNSFLNHFIGQSRLFLHRHGMDRLLKFLRKSGVAPLAEYIRDKANVSKTSNKPQLNQELHQQLKPYFAEDIEKLEQLINRDLSVWK